MCGILGIVSKSPNSDKSWLKKGLNSLLHRGPDDCGEWISSEGHVGLAHRRLSIVDLSMAGHQPMQDPDNGLVIVFNGEIYNFLKLRKELSLKGYSFYSQTDTEVVMKAYVEWGTDCLKKFNGMFAFALYDPRNQLVFLARDRAGEKPLFLFNNGEELRFASELKALLTDESLARKLDHESMDIYLAMGYIPGDRCILKGFSKLKAAHAMTFDIKLGKSRTWQYWQLPDSPEKTEYRANKEELLWELKSLLCDSVKRQLVADVPVGVLLSGGLDSSLITSFAVQSSPRVKTFTIGFAGDVLMDERKHARLIANYFGTEHIELEANPATADIIIKLARQFDEPIIDSSMIPTYLVSHLVSQHCKVALGGDGGDELFGGYGHYSRLLWMKEKFEPIPLVFRKAVSSYAEKILPTGVKGRNWLQGFGVDLKEHVPLIGYFFDPLTRSKLMKNSQHLSVSKNSVSNLINGISKHSNELLYGATRMDFQNYLAEDILVKVDRASMFNSLELRAPMLDYRLIEFAFGKIPATYKATKFEKKILLKELASQLMPKEFDFKRKQGFSIPLNDWLKSGPFRKLFWDVLKDPGCIFDPFQINLLLEGQDKGRNNAERLFGLVIFELWRREYQVTL
jgi:asparagine synthase (glutamine-hydrolysing)